MPSFIVLGRDEGGKAHASWFGADDRPAAERAAALKDVFRRSFSGGQVMLTAGVADLDAADRLSVLDAVRGFDAFTSGCAPYGEHDFGALEHDGTRYFWKIDAYDRSHADVSPDPADPAVTARVLTIVRGDGY